MATKIKPQRLNTTGTPTPGQALTYVDEDTFGVANISGGGGSSEKNVILGEDVTAGDGKGAVFYGTGIENTLLVEQTYGGDDIIVGNGVSIKAREKITVPNASDFANILRNKILSIKKNGSPTDNLTFSLYEIDGTTLILDLNDIAGGTLTTSDQDINILSSDVDLSGYEGQDIYLIAERDGAQDASNYYLLEGQTGGDTVETYDGATWNDINKSLVSTAQRGYNFEEDKVWLFDARYDSTRKMNGVVVESGVAGNTKNMIKTGGLTQTSVSIGDIYYGDDSVALIGSQTTEVESSTYNFSDNLWHTYRIFTMTGNQYIEKISVYMKATSGSAGNYVTAKVLLNGAEIGHVNRANTSGAGTNEISINKYLTFGETLTVQVQSPSYPSTYGYINNATLYTQEYTGGRGLFTNSLPALFTPFVVGKGTTNTEIELMINEQNYSSTLEEAVLNNTVYTAKFDGAVTGYAYNTSTSVLIQGYADNIDGATTRRNAQSSGGSSNRCGISFPVSKGQKFKIFADQGTGTTVFAGYVLYKF